MAKKRTRPIIVPKDIKVARSGSLIKITGPLGTNEVTVSAKVQVEIKDDQIMVKNIDESTEAQAQQGTIRTLILNAIDGVAKGYQKTLIVQGTGYRAQLGGGGLQLFLGYTKPVTIVFPKEIKCELNTVKSADKGDLTYITIKGHNKQQIGDLAADIRATRIPDPYKHKGVRYADEVLRKKVGKRAVVQA